ncbi:MAG: CoB--CoM heterodisulfide reductase iron-sulfur subunit A family protein [Deferrisomatales bacterium]|nr:CoB--CoM heterodisulfide reductase iron-sulfur subunit A family protein [Deferrisomatales bacterium]
MSSAPPPGDRAGTAVYICHCGHNIAATVDVEAVAQGLESRPGVAVVRHYPYLCSRPGQELIRRDLEDGRAGRVVVAACSPRMHEATFRKAVAEAGTNPYLFRHVNIREQCSWVHPDRAEATAKAADLIDMGLARVRHQEPLEGSEAPVTPRALVLGGGPAGLAAAADLANMGVDVVLVEKAPHLGGRARELGRSFPEGGAVGPWLAERVDEVERHPRVEVLLGSRLTAQDGSPGCYQATLETPAGSITREVGAIIVATGFDLYRPDDPEQGRPELGYGSTPRIVTQQELEDRLRAGEETAPVTVEGTPVHSAAFLQCIGSRDQTTAGAHCSRTCCMVSVRQAEELQKRNPEARVQVVYMDLRAYARGAEEAYEQTARAGVLFRRGSASEIYPKGDRLAVRFEDTLLGRAEELDADLVVLACGARPQPDTPGLAHTLHLARSPDGFYLEAHPKLRPSETASEGIYLAGACQGPKTIDEAVSAGRAAAVKAAIPLLRGSIPVDPVVAEVEFDRCSGCGLCQESCPVGAIAPLPHTGRMTVDPTRCKGCGACAAVCPNNAANLRHYRAKQLLAELEAASR